MIRSSHMVPLLGSAPRWVCSWRRTHPGRSECLQGAAAPRGGLVFEVTPADDLDVALLSLSLFKDTKLSFLFTPFRPVSASLSL